MLVDSIFPYWLGTQWDFNGYTEKPRDGLVACGYFVSTTIRDAGIPINRFKTAQKASSDIIKSLCDPTSIKTVTSIEKVRDYLSTIDDGEVLIVGLDFHVGFLYKKNGQSYFAHSNYIDLEGVIIEPIEASIALNGSEIYVLGNLTSNEQITKKWLGV